MGILFYFDLTFCFFVFYLRASKKKGSRFGYMGQLIAICQVVEQNYVANDAYRALVEASIDENERDSLRLIINTTDGELHEELLLQNRLLVRVLFFSCSYISDYF